MRANALLTFLRTLFCTYCTNVGIINWLITLIILFVLMYKIFSLIKIYLLTSLRRRMDMQTWNRYATETDVFINARIQQSHVMTSARLNSMRMHTEYVFRCFMSHISICRFFRHLGLYCLLITYGLNIHLKRTCVY